MLISIRKSFVGHETRQVEKHQLLAQKTVDGQLNIIDNPKFNELKHFYDHN